MTRVDQWTQKWEGNLKAGELKFTCDKSTDWYGAWWLASTVDKVPGGEAEPMIFIDKSSDAVAATGIKELDQKWIITIRWPVPHPNLMQTGPASLVTCVRRMWSRVI